MMGTFEFAQKNMLNLFVLIVVFILILIYFAIKYKRILKQLGNLAVLRSLMPEAKLGKKIWKNVFLLLALSMMILALAQPRRIIETKTQKVKGSEIVLVVDVSNSMLARKSPNDFSRLDKAKTALLRLMRQMKNDQVGLVIFAGEAALVSPITDDLELVKMYVANLQTTYLSSQGTAIAEALQLAINAFTSDEKTNKAIILVSDGEDWGGGVSQIAKIAKERGIKIYTVGVGSVRGNPIYLPNGKLLEYKGQVVISKLNEQTLKELAALTGGAYVNVNDRISAIDMIYKQIQKDAENSIIQKTAKYDEVFDYFVALAIVFLILSMILLERKNRILQKLKFFEK